MSKINPNQVPPARFIALIFTIILLLILSGCVTVDVINLSEINARVLIQLPDAPGGYTRLVRPAGTTSTFSMHGGRVTIKTLPDEEYRSLLQELRTEITVRLINEGETLTVDDVKRLTARLNDVDEQMELLATRMGASCTVNAPDFSSVTALLSWNSETSDWVLSCSVATSE